MKELLQFAIQAAEQAGRITLKYFQNNVQVEIKPDNSPVTIADRQAEESIRSEIEKRFPNDGIIGEEFGEKTGTSGFRWLLDPIDGTKSFVRGVPLYGTMIGLEKDGQAVLGVIRYPPVNQTLAALQGAGCAMNGIPCSVSKTSDLSKALITMSSCGDVIRDWGEETFIQLVKETGLHRTWGDCYGYMMVATGQADICFDTKMNIWDIAALIPIIQEAGGIITNREGESSIQIRSAIAANAILHPKMLEIVRS